MDTSKVNINELIDKARFTSFHWKVALLHKPICKGFFSDIIFK